MNEIQIRARAKINFSIDITGKRSDGYHEVKMIMQSVNLHDLIEIVRTTAGIELDCRAKNVPSDESNIAYKAAQIFLEEYPQSSGVKITINKVIPVAAGLAGGSADAAGVLVGLNSLFETGLRNEELCRIGLKLGADVPFCIRGGTMLAEGIGEKLTVLPQVSGLIILIVKPGIDVSTKWVYQNFRIDESVQRPDTAGIIKAMEEKRYIFLSNNMRNVLESVTAKEYPIINEIKSRLVEFGALGSIMSGSGSAVFGVFESLQMAEKAAERIKEFGWEYYITETFCGDNFFS